MSPKAMTFGGDPFQSLHPSLGRATFGHASSVAPCPPLTSYAPIHIAGHRVYFLDTARSATNGHA